MHNGLLRLRRRGDAQVARQRRHAAERARDVGEGDAAPLLHDGPLAQAARLHRRDARRGGRAGGAASATSSARRRSRARGRLGALRAALDDDFNTPEALAVMHEWRDHDLLRRALDVFGLESLAELLEAPPEVVALARARRGARQSGASTRPDQLRAEIEAAGLDRPRLGRRVPARSPVVTREQVYGRRPRARGAPRAPRRARALGDRARARGRAVAARQRQARPREAGARADRGRRDPRPPGRARVGRAVQVRGPATSSAAAERR